MVTIGNTTHHYHQSSPNQSWIRDIVLILIGAVSYGGVDYLLPKIFDQQRNHASAQEPQYEAKLIAGKPPSAKDPTDLRLGIRVTDHP